MKYEIPKSCRVYGKTLETWTIEDENGRKRTIQEEIEYKEYDVKTGELVAAGSEDFSMKRLADETIKGYVWTWNGERRNKGGHRWFDNEGFFVIRKADRKNYKEYLANKYKAAEVQLRTF